MALLIFLSLCGFAFVVTLVVMAVRWGYSR
jgi:hypothetical protein